ncbi:MAG TPA: hypothetical protein VIH57_23010 [Bacteroidales bacterium]
MVKNFLYLIVVVALIASSCRSNSKKTTGDFGSSDSSATESALPLDEKAMEDLVQNISSPVEMAELIRSLGAPYSQKLLAPTGIDNFNTSNSKAFNLGVFAADLGYLNMYGKTSTVLSYITAIKNLADGINVGQFFDFTTLKRLATNNENIDSLKYISQHSFNVMDEYLRKNKRSGLSALMVSGVYVEGLFLITQIAKDKPSKKLAESIGGQKPIFEQLLLIVKNYQKDPYFANLISDLELIKKEFDAVKITITPGEPKSVEKNGRLTIIYTSTSNVDISDDVLKKIINQTEQVRNKLIK